MTKKYLICLFFLSAGGLIFFASVLAITPPSPPQLTSIELNLNKGWNMIGPVTTENLSEVAKNCSVWSNLAFWYDGTTFKQSTELEVRKGYLIFIGDACKAVFQAPASITPPFLNLKGGWNLISYPQDVSLSDFEGCSFAGDTKLYRWNGEKYDVSSSFEQGKGYWLHVDSPCIAKIKGQQQCTSHSKKECSDNDLYWYNSCGNREEVAQDCGDSGNCRDEGSPYCQGNDVYKDQVCPSKGCSNNSCYAASSLSEVLVKKCGINETCNGGVCTQSQTIVCSDTDSGKDYFLKGTITVPGDSTCGSGCSDYCQGTTGLVEYWCDGNSWKTAGFTCPNGQSCKDGTCPGGTCIDTDNGKNYAQQGTVTVKSGNTFTDFCTGTKLLNEFFCDSDKNLNREDYTCPQGCEEGRCKEETQQQTQSQEHQVTTDLRAAYSCRAAQPISQYQKNMYGKGFALIPQYIDDFERELDGLEWLWNKLQEPDAQVVVKRYYKSIIFASDIYTNSSTQGGPGIEAALKEPGYEPLLEEYHKALDSRVAQAGLAPLVSLIAASHGVISRAGPEIAEALGISLPHLAIDYNTTPLSEFGLTATAPSDTTRMTEVRLVKAIFAIANWPSAEMVSDDAPFNRFAYTAWSPFFHMVYGSPACKNYVPMLREQGTATKAKNTRAALISALPEREAVLIDIFARPLTWRINPQGYAWYLESILKNGGVGYGSTKSMWEKTEEAWKEIEQLAAGQ